MANHTSPRWRLIQLALTLAVVLSLSFFSLFNHSTSGNETASVPSPGNRDLYAGLPLLFEQNVGQTDERAKFISRGSGYNLFLTETGPVLALRRGEGEAATLRLRMSGADRPSSVSGLEKQASKSNYFIGATAAVSAPAFAAVLYKSIYPGTDLIFYGNQRQLEYDFKLAPGADPARIELEFDGAESLSLTEEGDLLIEVAGGSVRQHQAVHLSRGWRREEGNSKPLQPVGAQPRAL